MRQEAIKGEESRVLDEWKKEKPKEKDVLKNES